MDKIKLKNIKLFENIDMDQLEIYFSQIKFRVLKFKKNESIAFRGDKVEGVYFILNGQVITEMLKDNGTSKKIEQLETGTILAGAFIFGDYNYFPVDIVAKTEVEVLYIGKDAFLHFLIKNETVLQRFLDEISEKAQFLSKNLWKSISNRRIDQKIAEYFLDHEDNGKVKLNLSIKELAEFFNVSRPSLSRVLKDLTDNGKILKLGKGSYKIMDKEYLNDIFFD